MKKRLDQLTMSQFIDLVCGDTDALLDKGEKADAKSLSDAMRDILQEYRSITDPSGMKSFFIESEDLSRARLALQILTMCDNLVKMGHIGDAREILSEMDINADSMSKERVEAVIKSQRGKAKATIADIEKSRGELKGGQNDVRRRFDEQTASMMTYFKFQIDIATMKATLYAHMTAQYNREIKALNQTRKSR